MNRTIVLGVAAVLLFAFGVIAANTHVARGVIFPVTSYEADVNKDTRVNVADLGLVASKYGQIAPTATPVPLATATPTVRCDYSGRLLTYVRFDGPPSGGNVDSLADCKFQGGVLYAIRFYNIAMPRADFTDSQVVAHFNGNSSPAGTMDMSDVKFDGVVVGPVGGLEFESADLRGASAEGLTVNPGGYLYWSAAWPSICPDGTMSDANGDTCIGHGFPGTPPPTYTPTATPTATATPVPCSGAAANAVWTAGNGHCYQRFDAGLAFPDARIDCESRVGHLATLTSAEEETFILGLIDQPPNIGYWAGYTDVVVEGEWRWITSEADSYSNWGPSEPNNVGGIEHYAEISLQGWNDNSAGAIKPYFCESP